MRNQGITATMAGLAGGIFFIGYLFLQVPGGKIAGCTAAEKIHRLVAGGLGGDLGVDGHRHQSVSAAGTALYARCRRKAECCRWY